MTQNSQTKIPHFRQFLFEPITIKRALKISIVIGILLNLINQGDAVLAGTMPVLWKIILTFCVPFAVSSYSTAALLADQEKSRS